LRSAMQRSLLLHWCLSAAPACPLHQPPHTSCAAGVSLSYRLL
jgi:hypothetical protein